MKSTEKSNGKPKKIYWVEMPETLGEEEQLEFFRNEMVVMGKKGDFTTMANLSKKGDPDSAYFFNFDKILSINNITSKEDIDCFVPNFIQLINQISPGRSLVHSSYIHPILKKLSKQENFLIMETNLQDSHKAFTAALNFFKSSSGKNDQSRSYDLDLSRYKFNVLLRKSGYKLLKTEAVIKDLSLNSAQLTLVDSPKCHFFTLKDKLTLEINLVPRIIHINAAFVTSVSPASKTMKVTFDIDNSASVSPGDAKAFRKSFYSLMKDEMGY